MTAEGKVEGGRTCPPLPSQRLVRDRFQREMALVIRGVIDERLMPSEILAQDDLDYWVDSGYWSEEIAAELIKDLF